ncbi:MAG: L,D-transpeptidase family protein [Vibrio sp.]
MIKSIACCLLVAMVCFPQVLYAQGLNSFVQRGWISPKEPVTYFLEYPHQLQRIYANNQFERLWIKTQDRQALERQLTLIHEARVSPLFDRQRKYLRLYASRRDWYRYDLLATDTLLLYLQYAHYAPTHGQQWFFQRPLNAPLSPPPSQVIVQIQQAAANASLADVIRNATPKRSAYWQLVSAYRFLLHHNDDHVPMIPTNLSLSEGLTPRNKTTLVARLALVNIDVSGIHLDSTLVDKSLDKAIKVFQTMHGIKANGRLNSSTLRWLNIPIVQRRYLLAVNAERMRLWPEPEATYVQVNIPAYHMQYWYQGQIAFESNVIVGRESRPTPVMNTRLQTVVFNPTWNVPYRIMMDDILPKVRRDHRYLESHQLEIIHSWRNPTPIASQSIDWQLVADNQPFPFRLRQKAGRHNSLGEYKFVTPNRRAIYLHDTPHKYLFARQQRALSSGCVRVEHAKQFAQVLMAQPGMKRPTDLQDVHAANQRVRLQQSIPVQLIYQTAWYANGEIHYRDDIYQHDRLPASHEAGLARQNVSARLSK